MNKLLNIDVLKRNMSNTGVVTFHFDDSEHKMTVSVGEDRMTVANKLRALADAMNASPAYGGPPS